MNEEVLDLYCRMLVELDRMEAEAGCELPDLCDPTPRQRAQRLLDCDDPPRGSDLALCQWIVK